MIDENYIKTMATMQSDISHIKQSMDEFKISNEKSMDEFKVSNKEAHQQISVKLDSFIESSREEFAPKWAADAWIWTIGIICGIVLATIIRSLFIRPVIQTEKNKLK